MTIKIFAVNYSREAGSTPDAQKLAPEVMHTMTEKRVLQQIRYSPFIIGLKDAFKFNGKRHFVFPFLGGGELFFHLRLLGTFDIDLTRQYCAQIVLALTYMHTRARMPCSTTMDS